MSEQLLFDEPPGSREVRQWIPLKEDWRDRYFEPQRGNGISRNRSMIEIKTQYEQSPYASISPDEESWSIEARARRRAEVLLQLLSGGHLYPASVRPRFDETWGLVVEASLNLNAREAMRVWLKAEDAINKEFHLVVRWTGENDVTEDEFVGYLIEIAAKAGTPLKAKRGFDAVELIEEMRGRRTRHTSTPT